MIPFGAFAWALTYSLVGMWTLSESHGSTITYLPDGRFTKVGIGPHGDQYEASGMYQLKVGWIKHFVKWIEWQQGGLPQNMTHKYKFKWVSPNEFTMSYQTATYISIKRVHTTTIRAVRTPKSLFPVWDPFGR